METDDNEKREAELTEFLSSIKGKVSDEDYQFFLETMKTGYDSRNALFQAAGIDENIISKLQEETQKEDFSLESISDLIAPELRKVFGIELDIENSTNQMPQFKEAASNLFDEIEMNNEKLSELLTTFIKCYKEDTDQDWDHLKQIMLEHADKFLAPSYKNAEKMGLLDENKL